MNFLWAGQSYWDGFLEHWSKTFRNQDSIILLALAVAAVSLFIITRAKWKK